MIETGPAVDGENIIFYHFHGLKFAHIGRWFWLYFIAPGYSLRQDPNRFIYKIYLKQLSKNYELYGFAAQKCMPLSWTVKNLRKYKMHLFFVK